MFTVLLCKKLPLNSFHDFIHLQVNYPCLLRLDYCYCSLFFPCVQGPIVWLCTSMRQQEKDEQMWSGEGVQSLQGPVHLHTSAGFHSGPLPWTKLHSVWWKCVNTDRGAEEETRQTVTNNDRQRFNMRTGWMFQSQECEASLSSQGKTETGGKETKKCL